jgi:Skp family chaperone for outer membrane proteins
MKYVNFFLLVCIPLIGYCQKSKKNDLGIAYIEQNIVLKSAQGYEKNIKEIDSLKKVYSTELKSSIEKLNLNLDNLLKPYSFKSDETLDVIKSKLKPTDLEKLELYLKEKELIDKSQKNYDLVLKTQYEQKIMPIINKINKVIEEYVKANNIKIIYNLENISQSLVYIDKNINITEDIIKLSK